MHATKDYYDKQIKAEQNWQTAYFLSFVNPIFYTHMQSFMYLWHEKSV